jgi:hypothetical protein
MVWIENRSRSTRWILVPVVFLTTAIFAHVLITLASWFLSIFWGQDSEINAWIYQIAAGGVSSYYAITLSGRVAPKYNFTISCICSAVYFSIISWVCYATISKHGSLHSDLTWLILSTAIGIILAVTHAKKQFRI